MLLYSGVDEETESTVCIVTIDLVCLHWLGRIGGKKTQLTQYHDTIKINLERAGEHI